MRYSRRNTSKRCRDTCAKKIKSIMKNKERINCAIEIACNYASHDGSHHKQWVINQMLCALLQEDYEKFIDDYKVNCGDEWDRGIAP